MPVHENRISPVQLIGAMMSANNIPVVKIEGDITNVTQAVQYVLQKMKASKKWTTANRVGAAVVATGTAIAVGVATAGIGVAVGAGAAIGAGIGLIQTETIDRASAKSVGKLMRGVKALWKTAHGTKGVHRKQAADVLVTYGDRYICTLRPDADRLGRIAFETLVILSGSEAEFLRYHRSGDMDVLKSRVFDYLGTE